MHAYILKTIDHVVIMELPCSIKIVAILAKLCDWWSNGNLIHVLHSKTNVHLWKFIHLKKRTDISTIHPQLKTNLWIVWHQKLKVLLSAKEW